MTDDIKTLRDALNEIAEKSTETAKAYRESYPKISFDVFLRGEVCRKAAEAMERLEPVEMDTEGGGSSWWNVCGECRAIVDAGDKYCRQCGHPFRE